jgi:ASTRA-associated protein 1
MLPFFGALCRNRISYVACHLLPFDGVLGFPRRPLTFFLPSRHGRDHRLRVWSLGRASLEGDFLEKQLPVDIDEGGQPEDQGMEPWLLHSVTVSALNFCALALCAGVDALGKYVGGDSAEAVVSVPNGLDTGGVDFFHLPSERRVSVLKADSKVKTGMVMALALFSHPSTGLLTLVSGYENGCLMIHRLTPTGTASPQEDWTWEKIEMCRPHSQPVLSLDVAPTRDFYLSSAVDAVIAKIALPACRSPAGDLDVKPLKTNMTKHAGQQNINMRSDGKIFVTAGWDARVRIYSSKTLRELAVLKWHQEGCYSTAFATILVPITDVALGNDTQEIALTSTASNLAPQGIKDQRSARAQETHWVAAGGKDGKISLWDIY